MLKYLRFHTVLLDNILTHSKAETYFEMLFCPTIINQELGIVLKELGGYCGLGELPYPSLLGIYRSLFLTASMQVISSSPFATLKISLVTLYLIPPFLVVFKDETCFGKAMTLKYNTRSQKRPSASVTGPGKQRPLFAPNLPGYE